MAPLDVFIEGELINLCVPTKEFAQHSQWYSWFNNPKTTRFLEQGIWPNTPEKQVAFYDNELTGNRLFLIVGDKLGNYIGTVSLSFINHQKRTASIAMLLDNKPDAPGSGLYALECMARMVRHGFEHIGLERIDAGQHHLLVKWQQKLELLGFKVEGLKKLGFIKGKEKADAVQISVLLADYERIVRNRGAYWDSAEAMSARIARLPEVRFVDKLRQFYEQEGDAYYEQIFKL